MRILYFSRDYTTHDHRFLSALARSEHQIFYLRLERRGNQREDRSLAPEIEQIRWSGGNKPVRWSDYPGLLYDLRRVIRKVQPDLIHAGPIQSVAFLAALSGFRPLVSMSWGSDLLRDADRNNWMRQVTKYTLRRTVVLVGDCQAVREKAVKFGFSDEHIVTFPWGVDLQQFSPSPLDGLRQRLGWQDNFVLLSLRSWEPVYGVNLLMRAFVRAAEQDPDLRLLLLGGGSQATTIHRMLIKHGLLEKVYLVGQVSNKELSRYYHAADLYVSASYSDGSSVSLMEALACGKTVLVSDIPGNLEWISDDVHGWFFPTGDEDALVECILKAKREKDRLLTMGQASRALAEQRANWTQNFQQLLNAYQMAVAR